MRKSFVVGVNNMTTKEQKIFKDYIEKNNLSWWHWIDNFWLIVDTSGKQKSSGIRDIVSMIAPGKTCLILEVKTSAWSGFGPNSDDKNTFKWLRSTWYRKT